MKLNILKYAPNNFGKAGLLAKKISPEVFVGAGIGCMVAGGVMACKATLKVDEVIEEKNANLEKIHEVRAAVLSDDEIYEDYTEEQYSEQDYRKDLFITYFTAFKGFVKLYWPSLMLGGFGVACILHGHNILTKRNVAVAAALRAAEEGYSEYRSRVIKELGEDADKRFRYGIQQKDIEIEEEQEDGTVKKKVKKNAEILEGYSKNAKFFDSGSQFWCKSPEYNLLFLRERQEYANNLLHQRGHLFLNEVYDMLGIPRTEEGQVEGWRDDGVGFVDFGIYELYREAARDFVNGYENVILLDFNVDGNILDKVFKK